MTRYLLIVLCLISLNAFANKKSDSTTVSKKKFKIDSTWIRFDGVIKAKMEVSLDGAGLRFNIRNSRFGIRGDVTKYLGYRAQIDLSNEGRLDVLDIYGDIKPIKGMSIKLGQSSVPFAPDYTTSPKTMMFANRTFIAKYFLPSTRDIGLVVGYKLDKNVPFEFELGMFNGGKINNPIWTKNPSFAGRIIYGSIDKLRASIKVYKLEQKDESHLLYGVDASYFLKNKWLIQGEVNQKSDYKGTTLTGYYLQTAYYFYFKNTGMFKYIMPAVRWDAMGYNGDGHGLNDVQRFTIGVDFGFLKKPFNSVLRLNYENYFINRMIPELETRPEYTDNDKITLELIIAL